MRKLALGALIVVALIASVAVTFSATEIRQIGPYVDNGLGVTGDLRLGNTCVVSAGERTYCGLNASHLSFFSDNAVSLESLYQLALISDNGVAAYCMKSAGDNTFYWDVCGAGGATTSLPWDNITSTDNAIVPGKLKATGTPDNTMVPHWDNSGQFRWAAPAGTTNASDLTSGTLPAARIGDNTITGAKLLDNTVDIGKVKFTSSNGYNRFVDAGSRLEFNHYNDNAAKVVEIGFYDNGELWLSSELSNASISIGASGTTVVGIAGQLQSDNVLITGGSISGVTGLGTGTVTGPAAATEDNVVTWGGDNTTVKDGGVALSALARLVSPIFTTPNIGSATGSITGNAGTATALAADPTDCSGGQFATGIAASGDLTCATPSGSGDMLAATYDANADNVVDSAIATAIQDNLIVNADINSGAAIDATKIANGTVTSAEFQYLGDVTSAIQAQFTDKAPLVSPSFTTPTLGVASATTIDTGHGANELWGMNQHVQTTDNVTFGTVTASEFVSSAADNTRGVTVPNTADPTGENLAAGKIWVTDNSVKVRSNDNTVTFIAGSIIKTFSFGIDNVVVATDNILLARVPRAWTITRADCYASTDNVVGSLMECSTSDVTSCTVLDSWTVTNAVSPFTDSSMTDGAVASGAWLRWSTTSVGTTNSNKLSCTVQYRE